MQLLNICQILKYIQGIKKKKKEKEKTNKNKQIKPPLALIASQTDVDRDF